MLSFSGRSTSLDSLFFATSGYSSFNTEGIFNGHSKINSLDYFGGQATDLQSSLESKSSASPLFDDQSSIKYLLKGGGTPPKPPPIVFLLMSVLHSMSLLSTDVSTAQYLHTK